MASRAEYMRKYRRRKKLEARGLIVSDDVTLTITPTDGRPPMDFRAKDLPEMIGVLSQAILEMGTHPQKTYERLPLPERERSYTEFRPAPKPRSK